MKTPARVEEEPMFSGSQIASHYVVNEGSVRRWRRLGCPCHWYNAKLVRFKLSEVELWLKARAATVQRPVIIPPHLRKVDQPVIAQ